MGGKEGDGMGWDGRGGEGRGYSTLIFQHFSKKPGRSQVIQAS